MSAEKFFLMSDRTTRSARDIILGFFTPVSKLTSIDIQDLILKTYPRDSTIPEMLDINTWASGDDKSAVARISNIMRNLVDEGKLTRKSLANHKNPKTKTWRGRCYIYQLATKDTTISEEISMMNTVLELRMKLETLEMRIKALESKAINKLRPEDLGYPYPPVIFGNEVNS